MSWLLGFMDKVYAETPDDLNVNYEACKGQTLIQCYDCELDEAWSFVQNKGNKRWIWVALDAESGQVMAYHIGNREDIDAKRLWLKLPKCYRLQSHFDIDRWASYRNVIPASQHTESKYEGKTITLKDSFVR